jgi:MFS family permease
MGDAEHVGDTTASDRGWARRFSAPPAFKYPQYRNYWFGMLAAVGGFQVNSFGQFWLVHTLDDSPVALGYVGLATAIPAIALNLVGGVVADRFDKRRLIFSAQLITASLIFLLGMLAATGVAEVWHVLVIAFISGGVSAFNQPAQMALYPYLVKRDALMSAVALNSSVWQGTRIVAPAVAGGLIWFAGTSSPFFLAAFGGVAFALVVSRLDVQPEEKVQQPKAFSDLLEGIRYIKSNSIFAFLIGMTFFNSFFAMAYITMMPVFADDILDVGSGGQGILMSVSGVGALGTTIYLGSKGVTRKRGLILIGGAVVTGLSIAAFALTTEWLGSMTLALVLLFIFGVSTSTYMISIQSSLQMLVPNRLRGRVMGFYGMTWSIMPLGGMYAGVVAGFIGVPWAIAIGGLLVSGFAIGPALLNSNVRGIGTLLSDQISDQMSEASPATSPDGASS